MVQILAQQRPKVFQYLKKMAPYSIVDLGIELATSGQVAECSRSGNQIQGVVRDRSGENFSVGLGILSGKDVEASCRCSTAEEMGEQWCQHAVALLWRACDLGFLDPNAGFASQESTYRSHSNSPDEIASVVRSLSEDVASPMAAHATASSPHASILLILGGDRLGVQIQFDGVAQEPLLFDSYEERSSRALDNILLQVLDERGTWDEVNHIWYVNASSDIEFVLGLIQEYSEIFDYSTQKPVSFPRDQLDAHIILRWRKDGADLELSWILPDGSQQQKENDLLGTGPYWTVIQNSIYRIAPVAARMASIFPYGANVSLSRSQVGPLLEALRHVEGARGLEVHSPELQPETKVEQPHPVLELEIQGTTYEQTSSQESLQLEARLDFEYPAPPKSKNLVFLPDRQRERECIETLGRLGFEYVRDRKCYSIAGDAALDLVFDSGKGLPGGWTVHGVENIRRSLRFSELKLNVSLGPHRPDEGVAADDTTSTLYGIDWFDCRISLVLNNANVPLSTLFKSTKGGNNRWVRLENGAFAKVPAGGLDHLKTTLGLVDSNYRLSNTIKSKVSLAQAIALARQETAGVELEAARQLRELSKKLRQFERIRPIKPSKNFEGKMRSYQLEGLSWLGFLHDHRLGGILADEMGLGKTVQALCLLQYLRDSKAKNRHISKPALVVAPTSVIMNWKYEARRFTPKMKVLLLHGPERKSEFVSIADYDLVITSYALLRLDRQELQKQEFSYVILDEAQYVKNPSTATTRAAKALRADHRLALTGTPTENRPLELWSIMDFLMPGYLGSVEFFRSHVERPILEKGTQTPVSRFLGDKTRPFILRRMKADVERDLPEKIESEVHVEMAPSQQELYAQILAEVRPKVFEAVRERGIRGASISILSALLRLRQVCNHPNSIDSMKTLPGYDSGKFQLLQELVREALDAGHKILVFSQFRGMLRIIRHWLDEQMVNYLYLDGTTKNRQPIIDQFNSDDKVRLFLISLKAGGTGLNLTAADTVIIYDPWWNPAVESQAVDRAHRIGQTKNVSVYRLVTENSIEQKIMALKVRKEKIVDALINENSLSPLKLTKSELENLFSPLPSGE